MLKVRHAVILAAGLGIRLRGTLDDRPKGFLRLGDKPIIEESIAKLIHCGISDIVIVTGHCHQLYDKLCTDYPVRTIFNPHYATTGSMRSLSAAADHVNDDFLLLESDLIYELDALQVLLEIDKDDCILLSGPTNSGDEVYVGVNHNRVVNLSKCRYDIEHLGGELVGISRISLNLYRQMTALAHGKNEKDRQYHYEDCLTDVSSQVAIGYHCVENLVWAEIDDESHLARAREEVYPRIAGRDVESKSARNDDPER